MSLTGIPSTSPIPRRARQFKPASGTSVGSISLRPVVLIANKLSSGSETVETLGAPIASLQDCFNRFGRRSEISKQYQAYVAVDPEPTISAIAVAEGSGAAASTCNFSFVGAATVLTTLYLDTCDG